MLIALDPGFGNTKVCLGGKTVSIQTAVARPHAIGMAATGLRSGHVHTVTIAAIHETFAVGPGAWLHGEPITSLDYSALASPERNAIFYTALGELLDPGLHDVEQLIIGLPVPLLQDQEQAQLVYDGLRTLKTWHEFTLAGKPGDYRLNIQRVKVLAQPVGAYADWLIDNDLNVRRNCKDAEAAVLDIGLNTIDLYVLKGGEVEPRFIAGGKVGVRRLLLGLDGDLDMEQADADLRSGSLRANKEQLSAWMNEIMAVVERHWPSLRRFAAVIPTGGGALLLGDLLRSELARRGAAVAWPEDPITANVRGLWKWYADKPAQSSPSKPKETKVAPPVKVAIPASKPSRRRGRPPKVAAPSVEDRSLCIVCKRGTAGVDGLCTSCRRKKVIRSNSEVESARIAQVVANAQAGGSDVKSLLDRAKSDGMISASKLG